MQVIPSDYRKYYPTPLPQTAVLRKPEGNFWTVNLSKTTVPLTETFSYSPTMFPTERDLQQEGLIRKGNVLSLLVIRKCILMIPETLASSQLRRAQGVIAMQVIKDYSLKFDGTVNLIDRYGVVEGRVGGWTDRVVVYKWDEIYKRNDAKPEDLIICEILREGNVVKSIKPHFVKASYR
ncbi:unnamed protein product [Thlaspi arvense]|uniref:Uncharacterized protein n=1 Tax=Thlaspi arvense TaxID=13288 RepID=A0AAU9SQU9_THLAR|nr:unnamed protein product [Thlaspi arvense]